VDRSQELLDWYGYDLCRRSPKVTEVICDDICKQIGRHGGQAKYLLDIWPIFQGANRDKRLKKAIQRVGKQRIWAWGYGKAAEVAEEETRQ
jgi:hypothetical protein